MKYFICAILFCKIVFGQNESADQITYDQNGFVTCYQSQDKIYFFNWDPFIKTPERNVRYFEASDYARVTSQKLRSCEDKKYIKDQFPSEILFDIAGIESQLPEKVLFLLKQVSQGAHLARTEKTAEEYIQNRKNIFLPDHPEVLSQLRFETGDFFASEVMSLFIKKIAVKNKSCDSFIGNCDFYLCQEQKTPCGLDGYNLGFGYKYCSGSKFKLLNEMTTSLGKSWVTDVFQCLQKKSFNRGLQTCGDIRKDSYDSHPDCYAQAGFCQLKGAEKVHIFSLIKKEILSFQTVVQGVALIKQCAAEDSN